MRNLVSLNVADEVDRFVMEQLLIGLDMKREALAVLDAVIDQSDAGGGQIKEVLHIACAEYVLELPGGLDTPIAESGGGLSEGQAQRISVARSLLRPGSIMIFDEATSALDEETEQEMLKRLTEQKIGKTLIFVTHRPAVIKHCTQILKIDRSNG